MMRIAMTAFYLATLLPLVFLLIHMRPLFAQRWKEARALSRLALLGLWLGGAGVLFARPHDDTFTGLDDMTYRNMAYTFVEGRGFHDRDSVLDLVPPAMREDFLFHRGPTGRPTRDRIFSLSGWQETNTKPFFTPTLPLAAGAQEAVLAPERFVPLVGAVWLAFILLVAFGAGAGWGLFAAAMLLLATAWPAWFLRGFYAEGVGAVLVSAVILAAASRPLRGWMTAVAGFALGISISYHPTLTALAIPTGIVLLLERRDIKSLIASILGIGIGAFPLWALTRWVCQPYGDWTRWQNLRHLINVAPEHRAIAVMLVVLVIGSVVALWLGLQTNARERIKKIDLRMTPWGWLAICACPVIAIFASPGFVDHALQKGATATWSGIRWPAAILFLTAAATVLTRNRPTRERFLLAALSFASLLFLFVKGVEIPVGLWSQRRFLPIVLVGIALLSPPFSAFIARVASHGRIRAAVAALALLFTGGWNLAHWPAPYATVNEGGAAKWAADISETIGTNRLVVFDYFPHAVPYEASLKQTVLGLGEPSRRYWPEVAEWLAQKAATQEVWLVTSWSPTALEDGLKLEPISSKTGVFSIVKTKQFFPAQRGPLTIINTFMRAVPLKTDEVAEQDKLLSGSPIGLRGRWGAIRNDLTWTREGCGIIGPLPAKGASAELILECMWDPPNKEWKEQVLLVTPPWGGEPLRLHIGTELRAHVATITRPLSDEDRAPTGSYTFHVERPYNPQDFGISGYNSDLGVVMRRITIR